MTCQHWRGIGHGCGVLRGMAGRRRQRAELRRGQGRTEADRGETGESGPGFTEWVARMGGRKGRGTAVLFKSA